MPSGETVPAVKGTGPRVSYKYEKSMICRRSWTGRKSFVDLNIVTDIVIILFARVLDVSLSTMRTILMIKGRRYTAAAIGFFEALIYVLALSRLFGSLGEPVRLVAYCGGFALGVLVGMKVEERLALGFLAAQVITPSDYVDLAEAMRTRGYGVTTWPASGMGGEKLVINVLFRRNELPAIESLIRQRDSGQHAFVVFSEPKMFRGGFMQRK